MRNKMLRIAALASIVNSTAATAATPEEYIEYDSASGNYVIWENIEGVLKPTIFEPSTKIDPEVSERVMRDGDVTYTYRISNSPNSEQAIEFISLGVSSAASVVPEFTEWDPYLLDEPETGMTRIGIGYWGEEQLRGIEPGGTISLTAASKDLAGVGAIRLQGAAPILEFAGHGVGPELQDELDSIALPENNSVSRLTVAPVIGNPTPFSPEIVLRGMAEHVDELHEQNDLDPVVAAKLTGHIVTAADAIRRENWPAAMKNLAMAMRVLGPFQGRGTMYDGDNTVEQLLARAFQFNIRYI